MAGSLLDMITGLMWILHACVFSNLFGKWVMPTCQDVILASQNNSKIVNFSWPVPYILTWSLPPTHCILHLHWSVYQCTEPQPPVVLQERTRGHTILHSWFGSLLHGLVNSPIGLRFITLSCCGNLSVITSAVLIWVDLNIYSLVGLAKMSGKCASLAQGIASGCVVFWILVHSMRRWDPHKSAACIIFQVVFEERFFLRC